MEGILQIFSTILKIVFLHPLAMIHVDSAGAACEIKCRHIWYTWYGRNLM